MNYQQDCPHYMHKLRFNFFCINVKYWVVRFKYFNKAMSKVGALGVMQLMPPTTKQLSVSNPFSARKTLKAVSVFKKCICNLMETLKRN